MSQMSNIIQKELDKVSMPSTGAVHDSPQDIGVNANRQTAVMMNNPAPHAFTGATGVNINDNATVNIAHNITNINQNVTNDVSFAEKLNPVFGAAFNSSEREDYNGCTPGTRVDLLAEIDNWIIQNNDTSIFWLSGVAGTGKSTIAHTVADKYQECGASFFFSRDHIARTEVKNVIKTLAYQLGNRTPQLKLEITKALENDQSVLHSTLSFQLQKLILSPLVNSANNLTGVKIVVVLDALDECNQQGQESILNVLVKNLKAFKFPLKFFITSRFEANLEYLFQTTSIIPITNPFILHNIDKEKVNKDIRLYMEQEFHEIHINKPWPQPEEFDRLIVICSELFIAASTAVKFIKNSRGLFQHRLNSILQHKYVKSRNNSLDDMYQKVLEVAAESEYWNDEIFRAVISIVVLGFSKVNIQAILEILGLHDVEMEIHEMLFDLKAVLLVPNIESKAPIHAFHLSFCDFLTNPERCKDKHFLINASKQHAEITKCCLKTLSSNLKMNYCNVDDYSTKNEDISIGGITDGIQYAAGYWMFHLAQVDLEQEVEVQHLVTVFLCRHILKWLEVISLCGQLHRALESIQLCKHVLVNMLSRNCHELLNDTERFILQNFDIIKKYPLQIYDSALVFSPQETLLYKTYSYLLKDKKLIQGYHKYWDPCQQVLEGHLSVVRSVAISQDWSIIVSGSDDETVQVWNLKTGELINVLHGHSNWVTSVAISHDGSTIVSGSDDKTIRVWNSLTGELITKIHSNSGSIRSVAISSNGSVIVSGCGKSTARVWDSQGGKLIHELKGHSGSVNSVAISQNGSMIVSGSNDGIVRVWNSHTGKLVNELHGHTSYILSAAISWDGSRIVSASHDRTVWLWNTQTGELVKKFHAGSSYIISVAISQDGSTIVYGSTDKTVHIWNAQTGELGNELQGHTDSVRSVAISQDCSTIVSGSNDKTIRVWNSQTGEVIDKLSGHSRTVKSIDISQNGSLIASGSDDKTVRVWNLQTGELIKELQGHLDTVRSVSISQDCTIIVSGSYDKTVRVCNSQTGELIHTLQGHHGVVISVAISQDGSIIASSSFDKTICLWNSKTGQLINVLQGHSASVISVSISCDGSTIVSGSFDKTARVWNAQTGELVNVLQGHTGSVIVVAISQNGTTIISGSMDKTVRIWNSLTGDCMHIWIVHEPIWSAKFYENDKYVIANGQKVLMLSTFSEIDPYSRFLSTYLIVDDWIIKSGSKLLCLPPDYRRSGSSVMALATDRMVIGTITGQVAVISLSADE